MVELKDDAYGATRRPDHQQQRDAGEAREELERLPDTADGSLLARILEEMADAVIAFDDQQRIVYLNRAAELAYDASRDEMVGRRLADLHSWRWLHPDAEADAIRALAERGAWRGDNIHVTRAGREIYVESTVTVLRDASGSRVGLLATIRDVTEQRATEAALRSALAARDAFLGLVSHELRTPMTIILGMGRLLARGELPAATVQELATDITESGEELDDLIESMLLLARLDDGGPARSTQPLLLHHVAVNVLQQQRERDPSRPYILKVETRATLVDAEETWLERILFNLLGNSAKHSTLGRPVEVVIESGSEEVRVRVLDEGENLPAHDIDHLFEPFYRGSDQRPGAGLGLAVCKRITDALGGRIWARPRPTGGAEFGFALPILLPGESRSDKPG